MINPKNILTITKKELRHYFDNPTAYIVMIVFLLLWQFLFFRSVFLIGQASLSSLFDWLPWLFLILVPAITMGSISQEKSEGTLEFLLTNPLKELELLTGKFLGSMIFIALTLLFIFPIALCLSFFGDMDWGVVTGQYLASMGLAAVMIALGIFISSLVSSQISALLVIAVSGFFLMVAGLELVTASLPLSIAPLLERLSLLSHFESMSRGVIDLRDAWYFLSGTVIFFSLAWLQLLKRKFGSRRKIYRTHSLGVTIFIGIAILTNIIGGRIPGRVDLTQEGVYTLSQSTKDLLSGLNDLVTITFVTSEELPAQLQPLLRDAKDLLRDYETMGKGNIVMKYLTPSEDIKSIQEIASLGIKEVQFNVVGRGEFQLKKGYLGLAVSYAGKTESIPFIQTTGDLEYQMTSFIKKLTTKDKKKIVMLSGHGEKSLTENYRIFGNELKKQFETFTFQFDENNREIPADTAVLLVAGPQTEIDETGRNAIKNYLDKGGSALFLIDKVLIDPQRLIANPNDHGASEILEEYGISVNRDMVYDLRSNETVSMRNGPVQYLVPYPLWIKAIKTDQNSQITARLNSMSLPWASSLKLNEEKLKEKSLSATSLFTTTQFGGTISGALSIDPNQTFDKSNLQTNPVVISLAGASLSSSGTENDSSTSKGTLKLIVVGDSEFLTDEFVNNHLANLAFGIEALSWLAQEGSLAGIQLKSATDRSLRFDNEGQIAWVKYGNLALALFLPLGFGLFRLLRRRNLSKFSYQK